MAGVTSLNKSAKKPGTSKSHLSDSESRFQQAAKIAQLGHYVWDVVEDHCLFCSEEHARIHGMTPEEYILQSSTMEGLAHPDDRPVVQAAFAALREGENFELEYRIVIPGGEVRFIREIGRPIKDDNGVVVQEIGTCQDITKVKQIELSLRESETRLREAQRIARLGNWEIVSDGRRVNWSPETCRVFGIEQTSSDNVDLDLLIHEEDRAYVQQQTNLSLESGHELDITYRVNCPDGVCRTIHEIAEDSLVPESDLLLATVQDITERVRLEEKLNQAQRIEAVGKLTGGIAHDFNNLLGVIQGSAELLAQQDGVDPQLTKAILAASSRGADLTHRLLAFSRRQALDPKVTDPGQLVSELSLMIDRTLGETVDIEIVMSPSLWTCLVDQGQLENALLNLVINSRDAMPDGGKISLNCANRRFETSDQAMDIDGESIVGDFVQVAVTDDGNGMSPTTLKHAIEPFFTTKEVGKGSGLGLSTVYGFIKQTRGHLSIRSEESSGTSVTLYLPRATSGQDHGCIEQTDSWPVGGGQTVLILEDDPHMLQLVADMVNDLGYETLMAMTVESARELLEGKDQVDVLLTDVLLGSGSTGPDFAEEVVAGHSGVPVLFMSGYSPEVAKDRGVLGADRILLKKPFQQKDLAEALHRSLKAAQRLGGSAK